MVKQSEGHERHERVGTLDTDSRIWRRLVPDQFGEFPGFVLVVGADDKEPPAPHDCPAFTAQFARQRDRLAVRRQFDPDLPLGDPACHGLGGLLIFQPLVLRVALGLGLRHRDVRPLPLLLDRMPAVQGELRLDAALGQHVAGYPLSLRGGDLGPCVKEDLRVTRTDSDAAAEPALDIFFNLVLGEGSLRRLDMRLAGQRDRHAPVIVVRHGVTLTQPPRRPIPPPRLRRAVAAFCPTLTSNPIRNHATIQSHQAKGPRQVGLGNNWVIAAIIVTLPFLSRPVALPVAARLVHKDIKPAGASRLVLARQMTAALARALPGRDIHVVADAAYAGKELRRLPATVTWMTRLRKDAALYELPGPRTGKRGLAPQCPAGELPRCATVQRRT